LSKAKNDSPEWILGLGTPTIKEDGVMKWSRQSGMEIINPQAWYEQFYHLQK
jgi:hypothetical protein